MKRYLLAASALAWAAFLAWGCASVHESTSGGLTAADIRALKSLEARGLMYPEEVNAVFERDYTGRNGEACDEGLTEAEVDSIYGGTER